jgi:hypothetical protein
MVEKLKQAAKFVKKHKKEILIGAAVVVGAAAVVGVTYAVATAIGTTAAVIDQGSSSNKNQDLIVKAVEIRKDVDNEVISLVDPKFPIEENARIIGQMGAVQAFSKLENCVYSNPSFAGKIEKMGGLSSDNYRVIDEVFSSSPHKSYSQDFKENVYAARGEYALDVGLYSQAYFDLDRTLQINPNNDRAYFHRALVNFENGNVENAIKDFQSHSKHRPVNAAEILKSF